MEFIILVFVAGIIYLLLTSEPVSASKPKQAHTSIKPVSQPEPTYTLPPHHAGNMYMSAEDKQAYLKSPEWQTKRQLGTTISAKSAHQQLISNVTI